MWKPYDVPGTWYRFLCISWVLITMVLCKIVIPPAIRVFAIYFFDLRCGLEKMPVLKPTSVVHLT